MFVISQNEAQNLLDDDGLQAVMVYDQSYVETISSIIMKNVSPPLSIALNGPWGSGKTTYLKLIERQLTDIGNDYTVIWFNPWEYARQKNKDIILSLMQAIALGTRSKIQDFSSRFQIFGWTVILSSLDSIARLFTEGLVDCDKIDRINYKVKGIFESESEKHNDLVKAIISELQRRRK